MTRIVVTIDARRHHRRYREPVRLAALLKRHAVNALIVLLAFAAQLELWSTPGSGSTLVVVPAALLGFLPLLWRRRFPFGAPAVVFAALAALALADSALPAGDSALGPVGGIALAVAFWSAGAHNGGEHTIAAVAIGLASTIVFVRSAGGEFAVVGDDADFGVLSFLLINGGLAAAAFALQLRAQRISLLEARTARLESEREQRARAAVAAERTRIARDLHDVIAHSVSVMTVQAGAARLLLVEDAARAREPLLSVEETGRQALAEMRRLLGILRSDDGDVVLTPQPGMVHLDALLEHVRRTGVSVEVEVDGEPAALPPGLDLAAYRIVQEALAHLLKHAHATRATVTVRYGRETLDLEISADAGGTSGAAVRGDALVAVSELVALYGGELESGLRASGRYAVHAQLSFPATEPRIVSTSPAVGLVR
jgi:signal transduction histidine kinase